MPSISEMERLGWGNPDDADFVSKHIISIKPIKGISLRVHRAAAPLFAQLVRELDATGAKLPAKFDDWGYANRDIRGYPGNKSYHAWGLAIDLDATENVLGSRKTTFPVFKTRQIVENLRFVTWGYEWQDSRPDPMHFEIHGARTVVKAFGRTLK
jgi:hypothetical protein